jgi:hypothetical protein
MLLPICAGILVICSCWSAGRLLAGARPVPHSAAFALGLAVLGTALFGLAWAGCASASRDAKAQTPPVRVPVAGASVRLSRLLGDLRARAENLYDSSGYHLGPPILFHIANSWVAAAPRSVTVTPLDEDFRHEVADQFKSLGIRYLTIPIQQGVTIPWSADLMRDPSRWGFRLMGGASGDLLFEISECSDRQACDKSQNAKQSQELNQNRGNTPLRHIFSEAAKQRHAGDQQKHSDVRDAP